MAWYVTKRVFDKARCIARLVYFAFQLRNMSKICFEINIFELYLNIFFFLKQNDNPNIHLRTENTHPVQHTPITHPRFI